MRLGQVGNVRGAVAVAALVLFGAAASAAAGPLDVPPWNIGGTDWRCVEHCENGNNQPVRVIQNGRDFRFVDQFGRSSYAEWDYNFFLKFLGCDNAATVSADLRMITFGFGPVWAR